MNMFAIVLIRLNTVKCLRNAVTGQVPWLSTPLVRLCDLSGVENQFLECLHNLFPFDVRHSSV